MNYQYRAPISVCAISHNQVCRCTEIPYNKMHDTTLYYIVRKRVLLECHFKIVVSDLLILDRP